jgi:hypothetical protein
MKQFEVEEGSATEGTTGVSPVGQEDNKEGVEAEGLAEEVKTNIKTSS